MTDKAQALIAKAISTQSESEAIACLKKARKISGGNIQAASTTTKYRGGDVYDWYKEAKKYHEAALSQQKSRLFWHEESERWERKYKTLDGHLGLYRTLTFVFGVTMVGLFIALLH